MPDFLSMQTFRRSPWATVATVVSLAVAEPKVVVPKKNQEASEIRAVVKYNFFILLSVDTQKYSAYALANIFIHPVYN